MCFVFDEEKFVLMRIWMIRKMEMRSDVVVVVVVVVYIKDMEDEIPDTKRKEIYCEVCRHNIKKLGWAKHLRTRKHMENEKAVEEVEKKQCTKCGCWRVLKLYRGENATCNVCLGYRESWAKKNEEKVIER